MRFVRNPALGHTGKDNVLNLSLLPVSVGIGVRTPDTGLIHGALSLRLCPFLPYKHVQHPSAQREEVAVEQDVAREGRGGDEEGAGGEEGHVEAEGVGRVHGTVEVEALKKKIFFLSIDLK